jgi:hypothetical protein
MKTRDALNTWLSNSTWIVGRRTTADSLTQFFRKLRPQITEHELIRIGGENDGGYLVPNDLEGITTLFSPGVDQTADFELYFANKGVECLMADYSVDSPPINHLNFKFVKKYLGTQNDDVFMTLQDWIDQSGKHDNDLILQMDIEGAEFGVLLHTDISTLRRFRIIVIEFHKMADIYHKLGYELINHVFNKLLTEFIPVHIHPNNGGETVKWKGFAVPPLVEITFIRKDRVKSHQPVGRFPHNLDRPCVPSKKDFDLPECWFKPGLHD